MKKLTTILTILCVAIPLSVHAQSALQMIMPPGLSGFNLGDTKLNPYVNVGFTHIGANFSLPIGAEAPVGGAELRIGTIEFALRDFDVWTGTVGLNAILTPKLVVFGSATGFAPHLMRAPGTIPLSLGPIGADPTLDFTVSNFEFWALNCGVAFGVGQGVSLVVTSTWDHAGLELGDPREGSRPLNNQTLRGSALLKTWTPSFGLQMVQPNYNFSLLYSPYVYGTGNLAFRSSQTTPTELLWTLRQPGQSLVFAAEYELPLPPPMVFSLSFDAAWEKIKGNSDLRFSTPTLTAYRNSEVGTSKYIIGGGIKASIVF